jgi:hypothetical protein
MVEINLRRALNLKIGLLMINLLLILIVLVILRPILLRWEHFSFNFLVFIRSVPIIHSHKVFHLLNSLYICSRQALFMSVKPKAFYP